MGDKGLPEKPIRPTAKMRWVISAQPREREMKCSKGEEEARALAARDCARSRATFSLGVSFGGAVELELELDVEVFVWLVGSGREEVNEEGFADWDW